jgi:hypothetical protein
MMGAFRKVEDTPQGGILVPAYVTRTGVFEYTRTDGTKVRELRHPEDVFSKDSLASLRGAPVTVGHPNDAVRADNWRTLAVGTTERVKVKDAKFVSARLRVQDSSTVAAVKRGDLVECSMGYSTTVVEEAGTYEGEPYDCRQTDILYNHVALGPKDWGRAGPEVRLQLDSPYTEGMKVATSRQDNAAVAVPVTPPAPVVVAGVSQAEHDRVLGELEAARAALASAKAAVPTAEALDSLVSQRQVLHDSARGVLGTAWNAKRADGKSKTEREIMVEVCTSAIPAFKADGKSDEYVRGVFDGVKVSTTAAVEAVTELATATSPAAVRGDGEDKMTAAKRRSDERAAKAGKATK